MAGRCSSADPPEIRLGRPGHPGRLQHLRRHRGLAGAARRLFVDRFGPRVIVTLGGPAGRPVLDRERLRRFAAAALYRRRPGRHRRGLRLRHLRRQCPEMVSRPPAAWPPASRRRASASARPSPSSPSRTSSGTAATNRPSCGSAWGRACSSWPRAPSCAPLPRTTRLLMPRSRRPGTATVRRRPCARPCSGCSTYDDAGQRRRPDGDRPARPHRPTNTTWPACR